MDERDSDAAAILRGQRAALDAIESGTAAWMDIGATQGHVEIHAELGVPIKPIPKAALALGSEAQRAEIESFVRSYNAEIRAAYAVGKLRDFRPRVLTAEDFEQRFDAGSSIRLSRNGRVSSPDGRYLLTSRPKSTGVSLRGPDGAEWWLLLAELDADFLFLPDGETLLVRTLYAYWVVDLPTQIEFSYRKRRVNEGLRLAEEAREAKERERRQCTTRWSGAGKHIENREFAGLWSLPETVVEDVHLEHCTLLDCRAGAKPQRGGAAEWYAGRAYIRNVTLARCELVRCEASSVVFENVLLDRTKLLSSNVLDGCLFDRVTLRGHIGSFVAETARWTRHLRSHQDVPDAVKKLHASFYGHVSWALDLTGLKSGRIDIGDIPVELVRVNPEICFIMSRDHAMNDDFRSVEGVEYTDITNIIWDFRRTTRSSLLFIANPRAKEFKLEIEALRNLRRAGIVT